MSEPQVLRDQPSGEEMMTALFAHLVMQQSNMAMMLLGKAAHPETGQIIKDMEAAKLFIDQLEMIEAKTKGNLNKDEANLLKQNLMALRLAFVDAVASSPAPQPPSQKPTEPESVEPAKPAEPGGLKPEAGSSSTDEDEHRKKFTKKY